MRADFVSGLIIKKKLLGPHTSAISGTTKRYCCKMSILNHDKMSSRVVLENDGAAYGKVTDNILPRRFTGKRKSRDRETSRPIPSSRILPYSEEKPKNQAGSRGRSATRKTQNPSGRRHFYPNLNKLQEEFSLMAFVYFRVMLAAVVLGKTKESYSTVWTNAHCPLSRC
ncbi:hypothetical protein DBV15_07548 [Temnothorax longispinosus]|uniref:Uncharacterized protein n=1 Tax=Temnothorax longispinosus TaxID=300112 RepID=A0A4S2KX66_9HYME|nr:hypothetical protein DBV15_07548 [Temnothorax longispinosus]